MIDFKIKRGLSADLRNPRLIIEEGSWYLCTDTAELFLGILENGVLKLKQINGPHEGPAEDPTVAIEELRNTLQSVQESLSSYVKKDELPEVPSKVSAFENDSNYATEQYVTDAIAEAVPVENLAKKEEVEEVKTTLESEVLPTIQETLIPTVQELSEKAATQEWVQQGYAKKSDIPTDYIKEIPSDYVTESELAEELANIKIPEVDTSKFVSKEVFNSALSEKADTILFKNSRTVTNPVGGFALGDDVKGFSIADLFAKLLGLESATPLPGADSEPEEIWDYVVAKESPIYSQNSEGNLIIKQSFSSSSWTEEYAAQDPNPDKALYDASELHTAYQIKDEESGAIIEVGYQEATDYNEEAWLTIALPSEIKNIKIKMYDPDVSDWVDVLYKLKPAENQSIENYTIWTASEEDEFASGGIYRFVIIKENA